MTPAFAYLRTSSATNVGADKDSDKRQRDAIMGYAAAAGYEIRGSHYDADVRGDEAWVWERPAFAAMMEAMLGDGVRTVIVETASRFARDGAGSCSGAGTVEAARFTGESAPSNTG